MHIIGIPSNDNNGIMALSLIVATATKDQENVIAPTFFHEFLEYSYILISAVVTVLSFSHPPITKAGDELGTTAV